MSICTTTLLKSLAITLAVITLTGCDMNLTANLYTVDLQEAMSGSSELEALAQVEIEVPSADSCDEYTTKFTGILHGILDEISPRGCKTKGVESFLFLETRLPVSADPNQPQDTLFSILLTKPENSAHTRVSLRVDTGKFKTLKGRVKDELYGTLSLSDSVVAIVLHNDHRATIKFSTNDKFVDGKPVHGETEFELPRRHNATIQLSNVASSYLETVGRATGFDIVIPTQ